MFNDDITIYHLKKGKFVARMEFEGVYFRHSQTIILINEGQSKASTGTITIPTQEKLNISNGDLVIQGLVKDEYNLEKLLKKYEVYKVTSVSDNRRGSLQHYKLGVQA